jgi:chemotaxis protein MotA
LCPPAPPARREGLVLFQIIGIVVVFVTVFGGFILAGGKLGPVLHALPFEGLQIFGAAIGAFLLGNSVPIIKGALSGMAGIFKGPNWKAADYRDLLCLLYVLTRMIKTKGMIALEQHIENAKESALFQRYPKILKDHFACDFICDTLRMMSLNLEDPHQVESAMEHQLEKHHHEADGASGAIQSMADAMPALGIVAAVLGIIKTMGSIQEPPEILGHMIGAALVGTFLGVFLAYGFIGPFATRMKQISGEDALFYAIIRDVLVAHLHGNAAQVSVEIGRGSVPSAIQPSFLEMEEAIKDIPPEVG